MISASLVAATVTGPNAWLRNGVIRVMAELALTRPMCPGLQLTGGAFVTGSMQVTVHVAPCYANCSSIALSTGAPVVVLSHRGVVSKQVTLATRATLRVDWATVL